MTFTTAEIFIFIGLAQGLFLTFALHKIPQRSVVANRYLIAFLLVSMVLLGSRLKYTMQFSDELLRIGHLVDGVIFLYGPFLYMYLRQVTSERKHPMPLWHFLPLTIHIVVSIFLLSTPMTYYMEQIREGWLIRYFEFHQSAAIICNVSYLLVSFRHLSIYENGTAKGRVQKRTIGYLKLYLWSNLLFVLCWMSNFFIYRFLYQSIFPIDYVVWVTMFLSTYVVSYYCLVHSVIFQSEDSVHSVGAEDYDRLSPEKILLLEKRVHEAINHDKIHLHAGLTLKEFSEKVQASPNDVSWMLNNVIGKSFYEFINQYRIKAFITKLENSEHHSRTLLALSMEVGFKSKSTFNKCFKLEMHQTPTQYIRNNLS